MQDSKSRISMSYEDWELKTYVTVERTDVDHINDVLEQFLSFLQGIGYTYVKQVIVVQDDGSERSTL